VHRVQRGSSILEDHRDVVAPDFAKPVIIRLEKVLAVEERLTGT